MRQLQVDEFLKYSMIHSIACSPSGIPAVVVSKMDTIINDYLQTLYVYNGHKMQPIYEMGKMKWFLWENNSTLLIPESITQNSSILVRVDAKTGEKTWRSPEIPLGIKSMKCVQGNLYAVIASIDANCPDYYCFNDKEKKLYDEAKNLEKDYQIVDELPFWFNGKSFTNKQRDALFTVDIISGKCQRITPPLFQTCSFCVIDGTIYYSGEEFKDKSALVNDIWSYFPGDNSPKCLYNKGEYNMGNGISTDSGGIFAWGKKLMMIANTNTFYDRRFHKTFYTVDRTNGAVTPFCEYPYGTTSSVLIDVNYGSAEAFVPIEDKIYFRTTLRNESKIAALKLDGTVEIVAENGGAVTGIAAGGGNLFCISFIGQKLAECYQVTDEGIFKAISDLNDDVLKDCYIATPIPLQVYSHNKNIDGFVMLPKDYNPQLSYPGILHIHGGPNTVFGSVFYHEMQYWANRGFFVFYCNPEGSEGRGDAFMKIAGRYGCEDYETLMSFTDKVLEVYPQLDDKRLCVVGGSYGGFMTNWIIGHNRRFACAVSQRSISNWLTMQTLCDSGYHFAKDQTRGSLEKDLERMWEQSPLKYAPQIKTPTLFIHSDKDYRCPIDQGLQIFSALKDYGVETRLCLFHGENHDLSRTGKPLHRIRRLSEITDWMERHV